VTRVICARSLRPGAAPRVFAQVVATAARATDAGAVVVACEPQGATLRLRDLAAPSARARAAPPGAAQPAAAEASDAADGLRRATLATLRGGVSAALAGAATRPVLSAALGGSERALRGESRSLAALGVRRACPAATRRGAAAPLVVAREPATPFGDGAGGAERWAWGDGRARAAADGADAVELGIHATVGGFALLCRCCSGLGHVQ